jgi:hypothetical protein
MKRLVFKPVFVGADHHGIALRHVPTDRRGRCWFHRWGEPMKWLDVEVVLVGADLDGSAFSVSSIFIIERYHLIWCSLDIWNAVAVSSAGTITSLSMMWQRVRFRALDEKCGYSG